jgi:outer membrane protein
MYVLRKLSLAALLTLGILRGEAQDVVRMTLEDAVKYALDNSNTIKTAQQNLTDADLRIRENLTASLPKVDAKLDLQHWLLQPKIPSSALGFGGGTADAFGNIYQNLGILAQSSGATLVIPPPTDAGDGKIAFQLKNSFSGGITVSQLVYSGSYNEAKRAARDYKSLVRTQLDSKIEDVRNKVVDAYLPALMIDEGVKTLNQNIKNLEKTLVEVKATFKAGFIEQLDVDRLEFSIGNLKAQRDNLIRQRETPINALKLTISFPLEKNLELADDLNSLLKPMSETEINEALDLQKRAQIRELEASQKLLEIQVDVIKASALPTVAAFVSANYGVQGNKLNSLFGVPSALVGVSVNYNIWDNGERKIKIQRAQIQLDQFKMVRQDAERGMTLQTMVARNSINTTKKNLEAQEKNLALAERIYSVTQKKYKEGVGSSLELTAAERDIYQAQSNVRSAQFDLLKAQRELLKALGK